MMDLIELQRENGITIVRINRPQVLNALNGAVLAQIEAAFKQMAGERETRAVIVTGAGEKAFVAGADIKELAKLDTVSGRKTAAFGQTVFRAIERFQKPVIAAINGFALGGGCELALACHIRIASSNARLGLPEVSLGLIPGYGGTQRLARRVGVAKARQLIYSGETVKAAEAKTLGLVAEVVPKADLLARAQAIASRIAANAPLALAAAKRTINEGLDLNLRAGSELESRAFAALFASEDAKSGLETFLAKRGAASFTGR